MEHRSSEFSTAIDRAGPLPGYHPSPWPVECGGNRRQKAAAGGVWARGAEPHVTTRTDDRWNVMFVRREAGELYLGGTMPAFYGPPPFGWLQRVDPESLEPLAESPRLPCGDHVWCGAIAVHESGDIVKVNGSYMHRLDPDCRVVTERRLPVDGAHNGLLILSDGSIVTKDLRLAGQGVSTVTRLRPDGLELLGEPFQLPEGSMGRIASDLTEDGEFIYIPGIERLWRIRVGPERLTLDRDWNPQYRTEPSDHGLAWDGCLSDGNLWIMDNGDIDSLRAIYSRRPNGRFDGPDERLSWRRPAPWRGRQRLLRVSLQDGQVDAIAPFAAPGGGIIAPPVNVPELGLCIAWDSINGGLASISTTGDALATAWTIDARPTMQPVVFPETGELVINDYRDDDDGLIVVDLKAGEIVSRVSTGSRLANGMFLTPGSDRDIYYCSTFAVARVRWR